MKFQVEGNKDASVGSGFSLCLDVTASDTTRPSVTPVVTGTKGANDWYTSDVSVSWNVSDPDSAVSDKTGCDTTHITADQSKTKYTCAATSARGATTESVEVKRDATGPTVTVALGREPDHGDWYNRAVGYTVSASDATSGVAECDEDGTFSGPDSASAGVGGDCVDGAGNVGSGSKEFKYDATGPTVTVALGREPDHGDWYNRAVGYTVSASDATSGVAECDEDGTFSGPDSASAGVGGDCVDGAGNVGSGSKEFKYDATGPTVTVALGREPDHGDWYNRAVGYTVSASDATSGVAECDEDGTFSGPDSASAGVGGDCVDGAGNVGSGSKEFKYDATGPTVTVALGREPDHGDWYNRAVGYTVSASDATSGVAECDEDEDLQRSRQRVGGRRRRLRRRGRQRRLGL